MKKYSGIILLAIFGLTGCSAVGVPYTNDPLQKVNYAYQLMNLGRPLPAEKLANEALMSFSNEGDVLGMAEAHSFFGQFYKSPAYRSFSKFYIEQGEYDPTSNKSISHGQKAVELFESVGNYTQSAKAQFGLANAYIELDKVKAC